MIVVTVEKALQLWDEALQTKVHNVETINVKDAKGYVLAEDIVAPTDVPAFPKSAMDGYAITYEANRTEYIVDGIIGAGVVWDKPVEAGHAVRIMTGAPIPTTCDTVIMQEQVVGSGEPSTIITIQGKYKCGDHIIPQGEECVAGTVVIPRGTEVTSTVQTILTGLGLTEVSVNAMPRVLVLTSGHEVIEPGERLTPGKIYNSNRAMICGLLEDLGFNKITHYHVSDAPEDLESEINHVLALGDDADIIISSGGVSVGLFDTMPLIYEKLGAQALYTRIQMRPGAASYGAITPKGQIIFGLSGNPGAAATGLLCVGFPFMRKLSGRSDITFSQTTAYLGVDFKKSSPVTRILKGHSDFKNGMLYFTPLSNQHNGSVSSMSDCDLLAIIPAGSKPLAAGDKLEVYIL